MNLVTYWAPSEARRRCDCDPPRILRRCWTAETQVPIWDSPALSWGAKRNFSGRWKRADSCWRTSYFRVAISPEQKTSVSSFEKRSFSRMIVFPSSSSSDSKRVEVKLRLTKQKNYG